MARTHFTYATRKSALALAQCRALVARLQQLHPEFSFEELQVVTTGDRIQDRALSEIGGKGLFIKEIEEALLDGRADFAVHSSKDVPPELAPSLSVDCFPEREDARDVIVTRSGESFDALPGGATIGTSSLRRRIQLSALRPDLRFSILRGNVDTRIRKCRAGEVEAIVLAHAGMIRLGVAHEASEVLSAERSLPAVGQGALAVEQRASDSEVAALLASVSHPETKIAVLAERGVMRAVEGNCQTPVAAYALREGSQIWLRALLAEPDGSNLRKNELHAPWPSTDGEATALGESLGRMLRG
ncbi:MAG TPA: hydroxymethylbilane synthase, partial [Polyangiaceae bacterium]|nr:hydroxymethylbilane synthase [Polyangiaceae bacterium]